MRGHSLNYALGCSGLALMAFTFQGCASNRPTAEATKGRIESESDIQVHRIPAGKQFAGFLGDYSKLQPNPSPCLR